MGIFDNATYVAKASQLFTDMRGNPTLQNLVKKFDGVDAQRAYQLLNDIDDHEKRVLAVAIAKANAKFGRGSDQ